MKKLFTFLSLLLVVATLGFFPFVIATEDTVPPDHTVPQETAPSETVPEETVPSVVRYDPLAEGILSAYYPLEAGYLLGVAPGTEASRLISTCVPYGAALSTEALGTGSTLTYTAPDGNTAALTVVVTGDLNGDATVSITDMLMIKSFLLGEPLEGAAAAAGDINYDGGVTITDFLQVKSSLLGLSQITAGLPSADSEPMLLLCPGTSDAWAPEGAVAFESADNTLVTVSETGIITAASGEGSAFVYGLDAAGAVIDRILVTILNEPLTVSLDAPSVRLQMGQAMTLQPLFNHPVTPAVSWASSDPAICTVDEAGTVTGVAYGLATVTATLANGSFATCEVAVSPPISSIALEKTLYKIKPGATRQLNALTDPMDSGEELVWSSSDPAIVTVDETGTVTGLAYGTATVTVTGKYSGLSASCDVKVCDVIQVAITFDDGPSAHTAKLLDFLKEAGIKATFFLVGERLPYYEEEVIREVAEGHEIGYHSYDHTIQTTLSSEKITRDFEKTSQMLKDLTGAEFTVWRSPGGGYNQRVLSCIPLPHIYWWLDTKDWQTRNADKVYSAIINKSTDGSIILLHDLHKTTVEGSIRAMREMMEGDYEFLTVTELISRNGTPPEPSTNYMRG